MVDRKQAVFPKCEGDPRFHQQFLEFVNCALIATLTGSVDPLLDAETMLL